MADNQEGNLGFVLNDLNARTRVLESKYSLFGERLLVINQNMIEEYRKIMRDMKEVETELQEIKKEIFNLKEVLTGLTKEMKLFARKDTLKILEKYINLWNPMNFVTEKDVINLIRREMLKEKDFSSEKEEKKE